MVNASAQPAKPGASDENVLSPDTMMAVAMSRLLRDGERVFHGVASPLPMVAILLARATHAPNLVYLNITGSIDPVPAQLPHTTVDPELLRGTRALITLAEAFDLSARGELDTVFLSGVQIDRAGRINMSAIGDPARPKVRLPGGAGSAFLMSTANRILLWRTRHDRRTFVEELSFTTGSGSVDRVVTPLCVFRRESQVAITRDPEGIPKSQEDDQPASSSVEQNWVPSTQTSRLKTQNSKLKTQNSKLVLESIHPYSSAAQIIEQTGFAVETEGVPVTPPPTAEELAALARVDPEGVRRIEFGG